MERLYKILKCCHKENEKEENINSLVAFIGNTVRETLLSSLEELGLLKEPKHGKEHGKQKDEVPFTTVKKEGQTIHRFTNHPLPPCLIYVFKYCISYCHLIITFNLIINSYMTIGKY